MKYEVTGELTKVNHGLVDYIADGEIIMDDDRIPCEVGYTDFGNGPEETYIFLHTGVTEKGNCYYEETIKIGG